MRLQRNSIKDEGIQYHGTWYFTIEGTEEQGEQVERIEIALSETKLTSYYFANNMQYKIWGHFCDGCPVYSDGYSSGYWIPVQLVDEFKAAWKIAKKTK